MVAFPNQLYHCGSKSSVILINGQDEKKKKYFSINNISYWLSIQIYLKMFKKLKCYFFLLGLLNEKYCI